MPSEALARAGFTRGLRELADWLDAHPHVPLPWMPHTGPADRQLPTLTTFLPADGTGLPAVEAALGDEGYLTMDRTGFVAWRRFGGVYGIYYTAEPKLPPNKIGDPARYLARPVADAWTPAHPGDTPGQLAPGEADLPHRVDLPSSGHATGVAG